MNSEHNLGEFEQLVLLAILRLQPDDAYGVTIRAEIAAHTARSPAPGAIYTTLERLERKGFAVSRAGDPTPQRGGRQKRLFEVTAAGVRALQRARREYENLARGLDVLQGGNA